MTDPAPLPELHLTPAERMEALIDAATLYELRRRDCERQARALLDQSVSDGTFATVMSDPVETEIVAQEALVEQVRTLMADGLLERCARLLAIETRVMT